MFKLRSLDAPELKPEKSHSASCSKNPVPWFPLHDAPVSQLLRAHFSVLFFLLFPSHQGLCCFVPLLNHRLNSRFIFFFWFWLCREISSFYLFVLWYWTAIPLSRGHSILHFPVAKIQSLKGTQPHRRAGAQGTPVTVMYDGGPEESQNHLETRFWWIAGNGGFTTIPEFPGTDCHQVTMRILTSVL